MRFTPPPRLDPGDGAVREIDDAEASAIAAIADLVRYWRALPRQGAIPARSAVKPAHIRTFLPYLMILERKADGWHFRLVGTAMVEMMGRDYTGERAADQAGSPAAMQSFLSLWDRALTSDRPTYYGGRLTWKDMIGTDYVSALLPLAGRNEMPSQLLRYTWFSRRDPLL